MAVFRVASLCLLIAVCASAGTIIYSDTTAGGPTWYRPIEGTPPSAFASTGSDVPYHEYSFWVDTTGSYDFDSVATAPAGWDNYLFLYSPSFDPTSQFTNALVGNDDFPVLNIGVSAFSFGLNASTTYILVTTGYENSDFGGFTNTIDGPGNITAGAAEAIPEPSTLLLLGGGLSVLGLIRRHRSRL